MDDYASFAKKIKRNMRKLFLSLLVVPFFSCMGTKESGSSVKNIVLDLNTNQELRLSEIADTVEMIPLEQVYDSDIAQVERIIPYKGHYYILNTIGFSNGSILVFDKNGNFVRKIDKRGGGPGEYADVQDIAVDPKNDELIFMTQPKGIYRYDLEGNFISKARGGYGMNIAVDSLNNYYITKDCRKETPYSLLLVNETDSISFNEVSPDYFVMYNHYFYANEFDTYNGRVYYSPSCCDSIFEVTGEKRTSYLYIDYNGRNLPINKVFVEGRNIAESMKIAKNYTDSFQKHGYRITDKFLYVASMDGENNGFISLYSFKTGKVLSAHRLIDDVFFPDNTFRFRPFRMPIAVEDDCLLWLVNPTWLLQGFEYYKQNLRPEQWDEYCKRHPQVVEICSKLDEESNPVLLKIKIKDF